MKTLSTHSPRVKLGRTLKQRRLTTNTIIHPNLVVVPILPTERAFGSCFACYLELFGGELVAIGVIRLEGVSGCRTGVRCEDELNEAEQTKGSQLCKSEGKLSKGWDRVAQFEWQRGFIVCWTYDHPPHNSLWVCQPFHSFWCEWLRNETIIDGENWSDNLQVGWKNKRDRMPRQRNALNERWIKWTMQHKRVE